MKKKIAFRTAIVSIWLILFLFVLYWPRIDWRRLEPNTLNVFAWGDILDPQVVEDFEKKSGIKVHLNYYSSNEELLVKLKATKGEGYDLIIPSDYAVQVLIRENLLKPIDKAKLNFLKDLNPRLLNQFYDPDNKFSIPWEWEIYGIGIDQNFFKHHPFTASWRMIFDPSFIDYKIGMVNDPIAGVLLASFYLYGYRKDFTPDEVQKIRELLKEQWKWVAVYADFRADYLLATQNCPVVIATSSYIWRTMRTFPFVNFVVPEEGTLITIENFCIPVASTKEDLIYRFVNHLYTRESSATHFKTFGFFPATTHALDLMELDPLTKKLMLPTKKEFEKYYFIREILPEDTIRDIWVELKSP